MDTLASRDRRGTRESQGNLNKEHCARRRWVRKGPGDQLKVSRWGRQEGAPERGCASPGSAGCGRGETSKFEGDGGPRRKRAEGAFPQEGLPAAHRCAVPRAPLPPPTSLWVCPLASPGVSTRE